MPSMIEQKCANCQAPITVRKADIARGWGKFCSKSCKAAEQERRTGQNAKYNRRRNIARYQWGTPIEDMDQGWDGHKDTF